MRCISIYVCLLAWLLLNYSMWLVFTLNPSCVLKFLFSLIFSFLLFFILVCYLDLLSYTCISNSSNYEYIVRFGAQTFMSLMTCGSFYNTFIMCFFLLLSCIVHIVLCVVLYKSGVETTIPFQMTTNTSILEFNVCVNDLVLLLQNIFTFFIFFFFTFHVLYLL